MTFAVQRVGVLPTWCRLISPSNTLFQLLYDTRVRATTAVFATFSTAVFGYGIVGLLRPLTVYPSEMVYWAVCPISSHGDQAKLNQGFRICLSFPFSKVYRSNHLRINRLTFGGQGFTLMPPRTASECGSFGVHSLQCSHMRSFRLTYFRSLTASTFFVWLRNMHLPECRTCSLTSLEVPIAMKVSDYLV